MPVDASIVFLPRFTTLAGATTFLTAPIDVSQFAGAQFQVWRGDIRLKTGTGTFSVTFEESLDTETWVVGPSTPQPYVVPAHDVRMFSYSFRLRWFRLKIEVTGADPVVTCWAEGLLRGGGAGLWPTAQPAGAQSAAGGVVNVNVGAGGGSRQPSTPIGRLSGQPQPVLGGFMGIKKGP